MGGQSPLQFLVIHRECVFGTLVLSQALRLRAREHQPEVVLIVPSPTDRVNECTHLTKGVPTPDVVESTKPV